MAFPLRGIYLVFRQETGSYAEFSRLLQHTADGNVFKKVSASAFRRTQTPTLPTYLAIFFRRT